MNSLHVTWQPPPNHTQITSYKLAYREADGMVATNQEGFAAGAPHIRLRKRVKHYEITGLGETEFTLPLYDRPFVFTQTYYIFFVCVCVCVSAPDRLYEVKVWACNKQAEGYPATWKGRTEKFTDRG